MSFILPPLFFFFFFRLAKSNWTVTASDRLLNLPLDTTTSYIIVYSLYYLSSSSQFVQGNNSEHLRFVTHCN